NDNNPRGPLTTLSSTHGTRVAGVIGAIGDNGVGVVGVNWKVQIMPVKRTTDVPPSSFNAVAPSIYYAANNGARVSTNSYGFYPSQGQPSLITDIRDAIAYAGTRNQVFVAAAGNDNLDNDIAAFLPASFDL